MSTDGSNYRVIEWWPNEDRRCIVSVLRTPENDAMPDEELIARYEEHLKDREHPGDLADD